MEPQLGLTNISQLNIRIWPVPRSAALLTVTASQPERAY
jgi:hypothetical protein